MSQLFDAVAVSPAETGPCQAPCRVRQMRALIDAHFARRIRPAEERRLRTHLPACPTCRDYYRDQLVLERALAPGDGFEARLAHGLGLRDRGRRLMSASLIWPALAGIGAMAAAALLLVNPGQSPHGVSEPAAGFTARGAVEGSRSCELMVYRVPAGASAESQRVKRRIEPTDELAFAYRNRCAKRRLLVFAVDAHRNVYWYHPAWRDPTANPTAITLEGDQRLHELPEAIGHPLQSGALTIHAMFTDRQVAVRDVEHRVRHGAIAGLDPEAQHLRYLLHVEGAAP